MTIEPIRAVTTPVKVAAVKRVARRPKSDEPEEIVDEPPPPKRSNPPGIGEHLDVTV